MRVTWVQPEDLIRHELWQSAAEGRDVSRQAAAWAAAGGADGPPRAGASPEWGSAEQRDLAGRLLLELDDLPNDSDTEPSDWQAILATLPRQGAAPAQHTERAGDDVTRSPSAPSGDRLLGAWIGRAVGCVLGKPVEKVPREGIEAILRSTGRWPLNRYFTAVGLDDEVASRWPWNRASRTTSLEENLDGTPEDDDLNYTLLALKIVETYGRDFGAEDVAQAWLLDLPAGRTFTAERVAYRNLLEGVTPPQTARVRNPFREWIGAQIRTDLYGWINPGRPLAAAEMAYRDASVSHTRNGLYGAMFVAAAASEAVLGSEVDTILDVATAVVPPASRLAKAIRLGRELAESGTAPTEAYVVLEREFEGMHWVHSVNNTALVGYALQAGAGDFDASIGLTVTGGWDTDSNGATVGALLGARNGAQQIADHWTEPLAGRMSSSIPAMERVSFSDAAARTEALLQRAEIDEQVADPTGTR
ncbi:ADP-ribosylglycohydrolase family protein [Microlunatus soli]|uniref:ADP-ribosylglycohydrolase n=1 Tax=Microlunatus soli TaxID=630515 RepID=A0A1H1YZ71_9ACTN|nr:ADP-ribosylglycohydrolase family protein [Microlunatus soli]SDT26639.1 ADP-ribosylglycohydrolase [Microlunatus soli]